MAENKTMRNDNIKKINEMLTKGVFSQVLSDVNSVDASVKALKKQIEEKLNLLATKKAEEKAKQEQQVEVVAKPEPASVVVDSQG